MAVSARHPQEPLPEPPSGRGRHARDRKPKQGPSRGWVWFRETAIIVIAALALSALVRAFLVQAFYVPSGSMEDTLLVSDRIVASKITTRFGGVNRGEVVVFRDPGGWLPEPPPQEQGIRGYLRTALTFIGLIPSDSGQDLVKRVIGVAGDRVVCCDSAGRISVNGVAIDEPYIKGTTDQVLFDVVVPEGNIFVMGDNRGDSRDSRFHLEANNGGVPVESVVGRAQWLIWPLHRMQNLSIPDVFSNPAISTGSNASP